MTSPLRSSAAAAGTLLLLVAACGSGAKPVPKAPPSTIAVVADEDEPGQGWPGEGKAGEKDGGDEDGGDAARPAEPALRRDACGIPVAVSMEALMLPGGIARIQQRLVARELLSPPYSDDELDQATLEAILELQRRAELPRVGLPSYATVRALGIDPAQVFASGSARCGGAS